MFNVILNYRIIFNGFIFGGFETNHHLYWSYSIVYCDIHTVVDTATSSKFKAISMIKLTLTSAIFIWHVSLWLNGSPFSIQGKNPTVNKQISHYPTCQVTYSFKI